MMVDVLPASPSTPENIVDFAKLKDIIAKRIVQPTADTATNYTMGTVVQPVIIINQ